MLLYQELLLMTFGTTLVYTCIYTVMSYYVYDIYYTLCTASQILNFFCLFGHPVSFVSSTILACKCLICKCGLTASGRDVRVSFAK